MVSFDCSDHNHRKWFAEFQRTRTWGKCPVRFAVPGDHYGADLVATIQKTLLAHYVSKEFGTVKTSRKTKVTVA
jgi:hypothetical protein